MRCLGPECRGLPALRLGPNRVGFLASLDQHGDASVMATKKNTKEPVQVKSPVTHLRSTPIGEYGFLSDGEVSALVSPAGSVEWMCVPRFDSSSVFGTMLGRHAGSFRIAPDEVTV